MAIPTPPVQTCILKVGIKCCKGCQTIAKTKLLNIPGVCAVEYNEEEGLLIVSGDVNPTTLVHKLTKWGKHAEIISVNNQTNDNNTLGDNSINSSPNHEDKKMKKKLGLIKSFLIACFGKRTSKSKAKIEPVRETLNSLPPMIYPPPPPPTQAMQIPYPPPYFGAGQSPQPLPPPPHNNNNAGMFRASPPPSTPYFQARQMRLTPPPSPPYFYSRQTQFPHMVVAHRQHYPGY